MAKNPLALLAKFDGSLAVQTPDETLTATSVGAARFVQGAIEDTQAIFLEEGTTNQLDNPYVVGSTAGWGIGNGWGAYITMTRDAIRQPAHFPENAGSVKQTITDPAISAVSLEPLWAGRAFTPGAAHTFSIWVYHELSWSPMAVAHVLGLDSGGVTTVNTNVSLLVPPFTWTEIVLENVTIPANTNQNSKWVWVDMGGLQVGDSVWATGAQMEPKAYRTSLCPELNDDATIRPGYAWVGPANASQSTRTAARMYLDRPSTITATSGAVIMRVHGRAPMSGSTPYLWSIGDWVNGGDEFLGGFARKSGANVTYGLYSWDGHAVWGAEHEGWAQQTIPADDNWHDLYFEWDATTIAISIDNAELVRVARPRGTNAFEGTLIQIGSYYSGQHASVPLGPVALSTRPLTPHERTSIVDEAVWRWFMISAAPAGDRQSVNPASWVATPRLYLSDIMGRKQDTLYPSKTESATAAYNDDWESKRQGTIEVRFPDNLIRLRNYVLVELEMERDDGLRTVIPLMHGIVIGHDLTTSNVARSGTVHLRDLTWVLAETSLSSQTIAPAGVDPGAFARELIIAHGVPASRVNIPDAGVLLTTPIESKLDERVLPFVTTVLEAGGMYQPWVTMDRRVTSMKMVDISSAAANGMIHSEGGAKVIPPITEPLSDMEQLYNRVTVSKITPKGGDEADEVIFAEATVTNRSSPVHPDRLRDRLGWGSPVIRSLAIENAEVATQAEAQAIANARLSEGASRYRRVSLTTYPDMTLDGHQILDLDLVYPGDGRHWYTGKWWQRTWSVGLRGSQAFVNRECFVTVPWR